MRTLIQTISHINQKVEAILYFGIYPSDSYQLKRKVYKTNFINLVLQSLVFLSFLFYSFIGIRLEAYNVLLLCIAMSSIYFLNRKRWYGLARFFLVMFCNIACFALAGKFGENAGLQYLVLSIFCFPFVLFDMEKKFLFGLGIINLLMIISFQYDSIGQMLFFIDLASIKQLGFIPVVLFIFTMLLMNMYFLSSDNELDEKFIKDAKEEFERQIFEARSVLLSTSYNNKSNTIAEVLSLQFKELKEGELKMQKANAFLKRMNNDLDNFIYIASHDLKTPMSNIEGLIMALKGMNEYNCNEEFKNSIERMVYCSDKFKETILKLTEKNNILITDEEEEEVKFNDILKDVLSEIEVIILSTKGSIKSHFKKCPQIRFNKRNLQRILFNLITNSLKFRQPNQVPSIFIKSEIGEDNKVVLIIRDNGIGMNAQKKQMIEDMLANRGDFNEVTGSGLYILKKVITDRVGRIDINTGEFVGTEIKIYFNVYPSCTYIVKQAIM